MAQQVALNIDCLEYMRTLPDKAFDLAIVDPPYGGGGALPAGQVPREVWRTLQSLSGRLRGLFNRCREDYADGWDVGGEVPVARGCL